MESAGNGVPRSAPPVSADDDDTTPPADQQLDRLVLVDPVGIKVSDRETADILDVFNTAPAEVRRRSWHDPDRWAPDYDAMSDEALVALVPVTGELRPSRARVPATRRRVSE